MKTRARIDRKGVRMSWKTRARIVSERSENVMEDPRENCFTILKPSRAPPPAPGFVSISLRIAEFGSLTDPG